MPVTILSALITVSVAFVGSYYDFWEVNGRPRKKLWNILSLVLGLFPLGCLWIFHLTFGKFWLYLAANLANNLFYAYPMVAFLKKIDFIKYAKFTRLHHVIVTMVYSILLYGYQKIYSPPEQKGLRLFGINLPTVK